MKKLFTSAQREETILRGKKIGTKKAVEKKGNNGVCSLGLYSEKKREE